MPIGRKRRPPRDLGGQEGRTRAPDPPQAHGKAGTGHGCERRRRAVRRKTGARWLAGPPPVGRLELLLAELVGYRAPVLAEGSLAQTLLGGQLTGPEDLLG